MVNINSVFTSDYLKADDFGGIDGKPVLATVQDITLEAMKDGEQKLCVHFKEYEKTLLLNKTNATNISAAYGPETDGWIGKQLVCYVAMVDYQGRSVEAIRVRIPKPGYVKPAPVITRELDDEVPF